MLKIVNTVSFCNLNAIICLKNLSSILWNVEFNKNKFNAAIHRSRKHGCTYLIFSNGKIVCTGCKSTVDSFLACRSFCFRLCKILKIRRTFKDFKITNVVGTFKVANKLDLIAVKSDIQKGDIYFKNISQVIFEPEIFNALTVKKPGRSILIFNTGRVILTGFTDPIELNETYTYLKKCLSHV